MAAQDLPGSTIASSVASSLKTTNIARYHPGSTTIFAVKNELVLIPMSYQDGVEYLKHEITEWLRDEEEKQRQDKAPPYVPWYKGGARGVRIDRAVRFIWGLAREAFAHNPYGLPSHYFFIMLAAQLIYAFGNITVGFLKAMEAYENEDSPWLPLFEGWLAALIIAWVLPLFLFPPLIANVQQQYQARGLALA